METITVEAVVKAPVEKVWEYWTTPSHVEKWCSASEDWHVPHATNDLRVGGKFLTRMESRDGKNGFDFSGVYDEVVDNELISYTMENGRKVRIAFAKVGDSTKVTETFDPETENSHELQKSGWQSILDNFKKHVESNSK